jgi:hypothetical protein
MARIGKNDKAERLWKGKGSSPQREWSTFVPVRFEIRYRCLSAELIENEAARIPDPNHWRAIALREMARIERECWEALFPASAPFN